MEEFMILEADSIFDSFEISAVNDFEYLRCFDGDCVIVSLFSGKLNCGCDDVVK